MSRNRNWFSWLLLSLLFLGVPAAAQTRLILRLSPQSSVSEVAQTYGLKVVHTISNSSRIYVVIASRSASQLQREFNGDDRILGVEPDQRATLPEVAQSTGAILDQSTGAILDQSTGAILDQSTGAILDQSTGAILDQSTGAILDGATRKQFGSARGVHRNQSTGAILDQSTGAILDQSTGAILDQSTGAILDGATRKQFGSARGIHRNQSTGAILDQSTGAILDQSTGAILDQSTGAILDGATRKQFGSARGIHRNQSTGAILDQSTGAILDQSTGAILDQSTGAILDGATRKQFGSARGVHRNQSTGAILDQSTGAILDQSTGAILDQSTGAILDGATRKQFGSARGIRRDQSTGAILDQSTGAILDQSTGAILDGATRKQFGSARGIRRDQSTGAILDQSTGAILDQSTGAILDQSTGAILDQSTGAILDHAAATSYYGAPVLGSYLSQTAVSKTGIAETQTTFRATGGRTVAVIDTGIDPRHPALQNQLVAGYDFVHNRAGASEWGDLNSANRQALEGSSSVISSKNTLARIDQSTGAILDSATASKLQIQSLPKAFGHGTMVAGIVHLTAPQAHIMALKAFDGDGNGNLSDVLRAIYYAADHGVQVIALNVNLLGWSKELTSAVQYAQAKNVMIVAAAGNSGTRKLTQAASLPKVLAVASTSNADRQSQSTSYGRNVFVAAPGERVVTTYPGHNYALANGTSFSSSFVAGAAAVLTQLKVSADADETRTALSHAEKLGNPNLGNGRLDLYRAAQSMGDVN